MNLLQVLGRLLARLLSTPHHEHNASPHVRPEELLASLHPGDVLLVEGTSRISTAIKYLTQSTWSHAALYVGKNTPRLPAGHCFIEADMLEGVRSVDEGAFAGQNCRICRPVGLTPAECHQVVNFAIDRLGTQYDLKNIIDLARYLLPTPPVPVRMRRGMLSLGSGDPTKAICSTLIAQAFQSIRYPILPDVEHVSSSSMDCPGCIREIMRIRHHSLFVPRDFDISPYFEVIKPGLSKLDFHTLEWAEENTRSSATSLHEH